MRSEIKARLSDLSTPTVRGFVFRKLGLNTQRDQQFGDETKARSACILRANRTLSARFGADMSHGVLHMLL